MRIFTFDNLQHRCTREWGWGLKFEKFGHKNATPLKNIPQTPKNRPLSLDLQILFIYDSQVNGKFRCAIIRIEF
jgi:hypothetical protein